MELNAQVAIFKGCLPCLAHQAVLSPFPHLQVHRCHLIWYCKEDPTYPNRSTEGAQLPADLCLLLMT